MKGPFIVVWVGFREPASDGETYKDYEQWRTVTTAKAEWSRGKSCY